jgi:hypothetical protein
VPELIVDEKILGVEMFPLTVTIFEKAPASRVGWITRVNVLVKCPSL